jgi:tRNA A-37 threonylcarbamoyl transferase component Bud32
VRRFVQQEDYALALMQRAGLPSPEAYGVVELTPEREYLVVTEFLDGATEIDQAAVDDAIIDQGLAIVRKLWEAGLAHRDIKAANLLVRDGRLHLIDVFFTEVRPSPWRQGVDLANMLLVLALRRSTSERCGSSPSRRSARRSRPPAASPCPRSCAGCCVPRAGTCTPSS